MKRLRLKEWLKLSDIRKRLSENRNVPDNILLALSLSDETEYERLPWKDVGEALILLFEANKINENFPILRKMKEKEKDPPPWDYPERDWYYWAHLLAGQYGWSLEYIAELDINDALALLQEIEIDRQFEREWEYQISEIAYQYDRVSKKSKFVPLNRPGWMQKPINMVAKVRRIPVKYMPVGNVIKVNEDQNTEHS